MISVVDGVTTVLASWTGVNQRVAAAGYQFDGVNWYVAGTVVVPTGIAAANLKLRVSNGASSGTLIFDAVRIEKLTDTREFKYDYRNRLTDFTIKDPAGQVIVDERYTYDIYNNRIETIDELTGKRTFQVYDGNQPVLRYDYDPATTQSTLTERRFYGAGNDELLAVDHPRVVNGTTVNQLYWPLADLNNTTRTLVARDYQSFSSGSALLRYNVDYDRFGNPLPGDITDVVPAWFQPRFLGRDIDRLSGLYITSARYYDAVSHTYLTANSSGSVSDSENPYRFENNDPINAKSDDGQSSIPGYWDDAPWYTKPYAWAVDFLSEGYRGALGDQYMARASNVELGAIVGITIAGFLAPGAATTLGGAIALGAVMGVADYAAITAVANAGDWARGRDDAVGITAQGLAYSAVGGAIGGTMGYGVGIVARSTSRFISSHNDDIVRLANQFWEEELGAYSRDTRWITAMRQRQQAERLINAVRKMSELHWLDDGGVVFRGRTVQVTEDLTHLSKRQLMRIVETGRSPRNIDGEVIHVHHVGQRADGMLWDLAESPHLNTPELHPLGKAAGVGLTPDERDVFDVWRNAYWQHRAAHELIERGL